MHARELLLRSWKSRGKDNITENQKKRDKLGDRNMRSYNADRRFRR